MSMYHAEMWFTPTELHTRITRTLLLLGLTESSRETTPIPVGKDERDALVTAGLVVANETHITAITDAGKQLIQRMMNVALETVIGGMEPACGDTVRVKPLGTIGTLIGYGNTTCAVELDNGEEREVQKRDCVLVQRKQQ